MSYSKEVVEAVLGEYSAKRQRAKDLRTTRLFEVHSKIPQLKNMLLFKGK